MRTGKDWATVAATMNDRHNNGERVFSAKRKAVDWMQEADRERRRRQEPKWAPQSRSNGWLT